MGEDFQTLLRTYRRSMGWTQEEMAQNWNYSFETISAWERKKRSPSNQEIPRLAKLFGMKAEDLADTIIVSREQTPLLKGNPIEVRRARSDWKESFAIWGELQNIYPTRTEFSHHFSYNHMFEKAHSILAAGISLNAIAMSYSKHALMKSLIEDNCTIQLCFLDPNGDKCAEREEEESLRKGTLSGLTGVNIDVMEGVRKQINKTSPEHSKQLEIRVYDMIPRFNIYIVDDILMTVQGYAYGRGEDTPTLVLERKAKGGLFDFYASIAKHMLENSKDTSESTETEI